MHLAELERARRQHHVSLRGSAAERLATREVHDRRAARRHRRRKPRGSRRAHARRQPDAAPTGSLAQLARATGSTTRRCRSCSRGCSWAPPARLRASTKRVTTACTSSTSRFARSKRRRGGYVPAVAGRSHLPPPARRRHRQHAPHRVLHRQAVQPRQRRAGVRAWSSCAPSRCRRTHA